MHLSIAEAAARRNVEIANDLVDPEPSFNAAALFALSVQFLAIVFFLALFHIFTPTERPRNGGVSFAHLFASLTASRFCRSRWRRRAVAIPTISWVKMDGSIRLGVQVERGKGNGVRPFVAWSKLYFVDPVLDAGLLFARDVHYVEGEELAGDAWKGNIQVDLHFLACKML